MDKADKNKTTGTDLEFPNSVPNREQLDASLEMGEASGVSDMTIDEVFDAVIVRNENG